MNHKIKIPDGYEISNVHLKTGYVTFKPCCKLSEFRNFYNG